MNIEVLSDLVITKVHSVSTIYSPQNKKARRENRSRWGVGIKYEGETVYLSNGKRFLSDANHLILLPRGCSYEWICTKAGHFSVIEFESEASGEEPISFPIKNSDRILKRFRELEYKRSLRSPLVEMESIRDTYAILLTLAQADAERYVSGEKQSKLTPALEYIHQNYHQPLTNDLLASQTGLSTVYFRKLFTHLMGVSPMTYVHNLRIEKAKEMLKSDYGTLSDVAQSLGYSSLYDFSRDFKKHTGVAPSKY